MFYHLGTYTEEPFSIIQSYFRGQHLERLVRHQIESYNHFINYQIQRTIQMFNNVNIHSDTDYIQEKDQYLLEIDISFSNFKLYPPTIHENNLEQLKSCYQTKQNYEISLCIYNEVALI